MDRLGSGDSSPRPRIRNASLPPQNILDLQQPSQGLDLGNRRTKSEPVDYGAAAEDQEAAVRERSGKRGTAANLARWLKKRLVVGGGRFGEPEVATISEDSGNDLAWGETQDRIAELKERLGKARSRIRKLESQIAEQKKEMRGVQSKKNERLEEANEAAESLKLDKGELLNVINEGREKIKQSEEMALFIQSQIRVFYVILKEELVSEEDRKSRVDALITNLEELGAYLSETSEILRDREGAMVLDTAAEERQEPAGTAKSLSKKDDPSSSNLQEKVDQLRCHLNESEESKKALSSKLQDANGLISELKYKYSTLMNRCNALEQGMTLLGAKINDREENAKLGPSNSGKDLATPRECPVVNEVTGNEMKEELKSLLHYIGEYGCWLCPDKEISTLSDLLSELRSAVASTVHQIALLKNQAQGQHPKDLPFTYQAEITSQHIPLGKGWELGHQLPQHRSQGAPNSETNLVGEGQPVRSHSSAVVLEKGSWSAGEHAASHNDGKADLPQSGPVDTQEPSPSSGSEISRTRSLGSFIMTHGFQGIQSQQDPNSKPEEYSELQVQNHTPAPAPAPAPAAATATPTENGGTPPDAYQIQLMSICQQLDFLNQEQQHLKSHLHNLSNQQASYDTHIPEMISQMQAQIGSLHQITQNLESRAFLPNYLVR